MTSYSSATMSNPTIRVVSILSLLTTESPRKIGLVEICDRLGIAKSTCSLVLAELCASGYLIQEHGTLRYGIGLKPGMFSQGLFEPDDNLLDHSKILQRLHEIVQQPISLLSLSRRSSIVTQTIDPVSTLAIRGFRRPYVAPFGACFLINATEARKSEWIEQALNLEDGDRELLRCILEERLDLVSREGYEVVYHWEQDILEKEQRRSGRWIGDLFEMDARMNRYRREILRKSSTDSFRNSEHDYPVPVSRIIIPMHPDPSAAPICIEFWFKGRKLESQQVQLFVKRARSAIADILVAGDS